jgi:thiosulfate/3-mercaptopyruvate sulfurtransferase
MRRREFLAAVVPAVLVACSRPKGGGGGSGMPWPADRVVRSEDLAREIAGAGPKPRIVHVGPEILYERGQVPGAVHAGTASDPEGLAAIGKYLGGLPHDTDVVLYCGCCRYEDCPNIRPAYKKAVGVGLTRARVLDLPTNLTTDWEKHGLPLEKSS